MKIVRNKFIPFGGYKCINLFGVLFVKGNAVIDDTTITHETIHTKQMQETAYIFFYLWYGIEWLIRLIKYKDCHTAYRNVSFEREAYEWQEDCIYPEVRTHYIWLEHVF